MQTGKSSPGVYYPLQPFVPSIRHLIKAPCRLGRVVASTGTDAVKQEQADVMSRSSSSPRKRKVELTSPGGSPSKRGNTESPPVPSQLESHISTSREKGTGNVLDKESFDVMCEWLKGCSVATPEAERAGELLCKYVEGMPFEDPAFAECIDRLGLVAKTFDRHDPLFKVLQNTLCDYMERIIEGIYIRSHVEDAHISMLMDTRDVWSSFTDRFSRLCALEVIFRTSYFSGRYWLAEMCSGIYKRNKIRAQEKGGRYDAFIKHIDLMYEQLVKLQPSIDPRLIYDKLHELSTQKPFNLFYAQDLCFDFCEYGECIWKTPVDMSVFVKEMITQVSKMLYIDEAFKCEQLLRLNCVLARDYISRGRFDDASSCLKEIENLQKTCGNKTLAPLVIGTEFVISQTLAEGKTLPKEATQQLIEKLRPYLKSHEGALIAAVRLYMAADMHQEAQSILLNYKGESRILKRLLGMCYVKNGYLDSANLLYFELKEDPLPPEELVWVARERAMCNIKLVSKSTIPEAQGFYWDRALSSIVESMVAEAGSGSISRRSWEIIAHICDGCTDDTENLFIRYKKQLQPIFELPTASSWNDMKGSVRMILAETEPVTDASSNLPNALLPLSAYTVD